MQSWKKLKGEDMKNFNKNKPSWNKKKLNNSSGKYNQEDSNRKSDNNSNSNSERS